MQAMMLAVANCYMLWALFWIQFVSACTFFGYRGFYLNYYTTRPDPFGIALPEFFLILSVGLALLAVPAVTFGTRGTAKLWRRIVMVAIFSVITIGFSATCLRLREHSFNEAIRQRDEISRRYQKLLKLQELQNLDPTDEWVREELVWEKRKLDFRNQEIERFQEIYGVR